MPIINTLRYGPVEVSMYRSPIDGSIVVQVDTTEGGPIRVNINDGTIWNADPESHQHEDCPCVIDWKHR